MTGPRRRRRVTPSACVHRTAERRYCRRPGEWSIDHDKSFYCWQHACILIRDRGLARTVTHVLTGEHRQAPVRPLAIDRRPPPVGAAAIVVELNRARNRPAFERCRRAIRAQIADLKDERLGITPPVLEAMHAARTRIGLPVGGN